MQCHVNRRCQCITQFLNFFICSARNFNIILYYRPYFAPCWLAIDVLYIFSELLISATNIGQFDIIFLDTICLKFFTVGIPTLLYIVLAILALSICLLGNPTIFSSTVVKTLGFDVLYVGLKTYSPCLFLLDFIIHILVQTVKSSSLCES